MAWYDQITDKFVANVANRYMQENIWPAFSIFPKVNTKQKSGYIAKYTKEDWLRVGSVSDYVRTGASESKGDMFATEKQSYILEEYAFHDDVTKEERAEYDNPFDPVKDAVDFVINRLNLVVAKKFTETVLVTGVWGTDFNVGTSSTSWSSSSSTPINDVMEQASAIEQLTGLWPNKILMTRDVFNVLKTNSQITGSMKTTDDKVLTTGLLAKLFEVDDVMVFKTVETTAKKGASATSSNTGYMASNKVLLCYAPKRPSKRKPSAGYHLTYNGKSGNVVTRTIPNPLANDSLRIEGSVYTQPLVVASDLGCLFTNVV